MHFTRVSKTTWWYVYHLKLIIRLATINGNMVLHILLSSYDNGNIAEYLKIKYEDFGQSHSSDTQNGAISTFPQYLLKLWLNCNSNLNKSDWQLFATPVFMVWKCIHMKPESVFLMSPIFLSMNKLNVQIFVVFANCRDKQSLTLNLW